MDTSLSNDNVRTFSKAFDTMKKLAFACVLGLVVTISISIYCLFKLNAEVGKKVFVVTDSGTIWATQKDYNNTFSIYEARNFVKVFCGLMFAHDANTYKKHLDAALPLINSAFGKAILANYTDSKLYQMYVNYDASTSIQIDSVLINPNSRPLNGAVFMRIITHTADKSIPNPIAYRFTLDRVDRSDTNPYGYFISSLNRIVYEPVDSKTDANQQAVQEAAQKKIIDSLIK